MNSIGLLKQDFRHWAQVEQLSADSGKLSLFFKNKAVVEDKAAVNHKDVRAFKINVFPDEVRKKIAGIDNCYLRIIAH